MGFTLAARLDRLDRAAAVEQGNGLAARGAPLGAQALCGRVVDAALVVDHHPVAPCALAADPAALHILTHELRIALQRIAPTPAAPGIEVQQVADLDFDALDLGRQPLLTAVRAQQFLAGALAGCPAQHPPGIGEPALVVNTDLAVGQKAIGHGQPVAAAVQAGAAGIAQRLVAFDAQREVRLDKLVGHIGKTRPQRVPVGTVAHRAAGDPPKTDLEELKPLAALSGPVVVAGVKQMRRIGEAGRVEHLLGGAHTQERAEQIENAPQGVRAPGERGGKLRLEQRALGDAHIDKIVEPVVEHDLRVHHVNREGAEEHLEHVFVEKEIHRTARLGVGAGKIEDGRRAFAPQAALDAIGPHAHAVIAEIVFELARLLGDKLLDDVLHRVVVALEHHRHGGGQHLVAEALGEFDAAPRRGVTGGHQGVEIEAVPLRRAHIVQNEFEQFRLQLAAPVQLDRRYANALLINRGRFDGDRAGHHAAVIGHMPEHGRPGDVPPVLKHGNQHHPVRQVRHGRVTAVRVVGQNHVALFDVALVGVQKRTDKRAELSDHHLAVAVGNHGETIALLADTRRHGGAKQHRVHFFAGIAQRVFDNVHADAIDLDGVQGRVVALDNACGHGRFLKPLN